MKPEEHDRLIHLHILIVLGDADAGSQREFMRLTNKLVSEHPGTALKMFMESEEKA